MLLFQRLLKKGDTIIEVGGHIGYISLYFKFLVGSGRVIVFEPGENNLPYLRRNVQNKGVEVIPKAVGKVEGNCSFFLDPLSGQNNSLVRDFSGCDSTLANAFDSRAKTIKETKVEVVALDRFISDHGLNPTLIKIDIEGFEMDALEGMARTLSEQHPIVMVEVQMNHQKVSDFLEGAGYVLLQPNTKPHPVIRTGNVFCFHRERHQEILEALKRDFP